MKIGNQHFDLKNMSKNQRRLLKELKIKYEQALAEGVDLGDDIFGSFKKEGKITKRDIENIERQTPSEFYQYNPVSKKRGDFEINYEWYRMRVEGFLSRFTPFPYTRKGRQRKLTTAEQAMIQISQLIQQKITEFDNPPGFGYVVVSNAIDEIPTEIRAKLDSKDNKERYDGVFQCLDFLRSLDFMGVIPDEDAFEEVDEMEDFSGD